MKQLLLAILIFTSLLSNGQSKPINRLAFSFTTISNSPQSVDMSDIRFFRAPFKGVDNFNHKSTQDYLFGLSWIRNKWFSRGAPISKNSVSLGLDFASQSFNCSYTFKDGHVENLDGRSLSFNIKLLYNYVLHNTDKSEIWVSAGISNLAQKEVVNSIYYNDTMFSAYVAGSNMRIPLGNIRTPLAITYQYKISDKDAFFIGIQSYFRNVYEMVSGSEKHNDHFGNSEVRYGSFRVREGYIDAAYGPLNTKEILGGTRITIGWIFGVGSKRATGISF